MAAGRATLVFYGHNTKELGHEVPTPSNLTTNVKLDLRTAAGTNTVKQRMRAQLAWLMEEGMSVPVELDEAGLATKLDTDTLETELAGRRHEASAQGREQAKLTYDLPSREELRDLKDIAGNGVKAVRGLFRRR